MATSTKSSGTGNFISGKKEKKCVLGISFYSIKNNFGISLGKYIFLPEYCCETDVLHEHGHQKQSLYLGWLYLVIIGIPSISFNMYDRFFHKTWSFEKCCFWYYSLPWEAWADKLGKVRR